MHGEPKEWPKYNDVVYPPTAPGEPSRPAEVVHYRANIKYSQKKLWYIAGLIRGMSVDEALKQLSFIERKGAAVVKEVIQEAQEMAIRDHNVEYKSNLWIEDSFVRKAKTIKGVRKHARSRFGVIHYRYTHYFLRLREGRPPKHYYPPRPTGNEMLEDYLQRLRDRRIIHGL
jgi:large subunit ribosomal protein L22